MITWCYSTRLSRKHRRHLGKILKRTRTISPCAPSTERRLMKTLYLTSYEDEFAEKLKSDGEFRQLWEAGETRRRVVSALIGARIRSCLSQEELAKKAGVKQPSLARVESGRVMPSLVMLDRL